MINFGLFIAFFNRIIPFKHYTITTKINLKNSEKK